MMNNWQKVKLGEVFSAQKKSKIKAGDGQLEGLYPLYTSSMSLTKYLNSYALDVECLIFGTGGMASVHYVSGRFSVSTDCYVMTPRSNDTYTKFVYHYLKGNVYLLENGFKGAGLKHISKEYLQNLVIPLPPLSEQKRIVQILDQADALRQKRKQSIALLDEYLKSVFLEMFGDPKINPKQFPIMELQELYIDSKNGTKCGPFGSALKKDEFVSSGIPVWNMDNISLSGQMILPFRMWITFEKYNNLKSYSVTNGDVIISRAGTVGKMCVAKIADEKSIISTNLIRVRFGNKLLPQYFVSLMNYCKGRVGRLRTGEDGSFTHMNTGVLDTLRFPYPSLGLQSQFVKISEKVESLKHQMLIEEDQLDMQFQSLMQKAFNGSL